MSPSGLRAWTWRLAEGRSRTSDRDRRAEGRRRLHLERAEIVADRVWQARGADSQGARRTGDTDEVIEGWHLTYGCPEDRPLDVPIAPAMSFHYELPSVSYEVDLENWWGFPEAL